jgi:hypothetical protein
MAKDIHVRKIKKLEAKVKEQNRLIRSAKGFQKHFREQLLKLVTSGFGLVSALAWNEVIKESVSTYIRPYFGEGSGVISLVIYALIVTILAVLVTYNLSKFAPKKED